MTTTTRMPLDDFLALEPCEPELELIDGDVVQKAMPGKKHSQVVGELMYLLKVQQRQSGTFDVDVELRHLDQDAEWVFLPDISVTLRERLAGVTFEERRPVEVLPDFAIEVLSPDDRPGRVAQTIAHSMRAGIPLLWVIDPETRQVTVWQPGRAPQTAAEGKILDAAPMLPEFRVDLGKLFAEADR